MQILNSDTDGEIYAILDNADDFAKFSQVCPDRMATPSWGKSGNFAGAGLYRTESLSEQNHVIYRKTNFTEAKKLQAYLERKISHLRNFADKITFK